MGSRYRQSQQKNVQNLTETFKKKEFADKNQSQLDNLALEKAMDSMKHNMESFKNFLQNFGDFVKFQICNLVKFEILNPKISKFEILNPNTKISNLDTKCLNCGDFCYKFEEKFTEIDKINFVGSRLQRSSKTGGQRFAWNVLRINFSAKFWSKFEQFCREIGDFGY